MKGKVWSTFSLQKVTCLELINGKTALNKVESTIEISYLILDFHPVSTLICRSASG